MIPNTKEKINEMIDEEWKKQPFFVRSFFYIFPGKLGFEYVYAKAYAKCLEDVIENDK